MLPGHNTTQTTPALWNAALSVVNTPAKSRGRIRKSDIIHFQEFENASLIVEDPFWRDTLHSCARNKFPRGFNYVDNFLHYRANNICIALPDDSVALSQTAIYFFQENGKLYSELDRKRQKIQEEETILNELSKITWTTIARSKNRRASRIRDYVRKNYSHLSRKIQDEIYTQINIGFELGFIKKENITFEDGRVINVDGIDADENGIFFTRSFPSPRFTLITPDLAPKDKIYRHYENWCKYLEEYRKYLLSSSKPSYTIQTSSYSSSGINDDDNFDD